MSKAFVLALGRYAVWCGPADAKLASIKDAPNLAREGADYAIHVVKGMNLSSTYSNEPFSTDQITAMEIGLPIEGPETYEIDPGISLLLAPTRWGKTYFTVRGVIPAAYAIYEPDAVRAISYVEPYELTPGVAMEHIADPIQLMVNLAEFVMNPDQQVLFLDSLRAFVYDASVGGTGEGGMDEYLSVQLTALSNVLARAGKIVFATLNPMISSDNKERYDRLVDKIVASVPLVIVGRQSRVVDIYQRGVSAPSRSVSNAHVRDLSTPALTITGRAKNVSSELETDLADALVPNAAAHRLVQAAIAANPANEGKDFDLLPNLYRTE